jgi:hypothetical protein
MEATGKRWIAYGSRKDEIRLWNLADLHWGARACAEGHVRATVKQIADDPYSFWFSTGDYGDFIGRQDKRFCPDGPAEWITVKDLGELGRTVGKALLEIFDPIRGKCLGFGFGNHDLKFARSNEQTDLHGWLCTELGVPNLMLSGLFDVVFCRRPRTKQPTLLWTPPDTHQTRTSMRVYYHHGAGYAQTKGGKLNRLLKFMDDHDADMYFMGHVHEKLFTERARMTGGADCTKIVQAVRWGAISGAYLKTYAQGMTTYSEVAGYSPTTLGAAALAIRPDTREIKPYW